MVDNILACFNMPGREKFCPGKLTLLKILPGKNSVPELKIVVKILFFWKGKKGNSARSAEEISGLYFLVDDWMKLNFPYKQRGKILSRGLKPW